MTNEEYDNYIKQHLIDNSLQCSKDKVCYINTPLLDYLKLMEECGLIKIIKIKYVGQKYVLDMYNILNIYRKIELLLSKEKKDYLKDIYHIEFYNLMDDNVYRWNGKTIINKNDIKKIKEEQLKIEKEKYIKILEEEGEDIINYDDEFELYVEMFLRYDYISNKYEELSYE